MLQHLNWLVNEFSVYLFYLFNLLKSNIFYYALIINMVYKLLNKQMLLLCFLNSFVVLFGLIEFHRVLRAL